MAAAACLLNGCANLGPQAASGSSKYDPVVPFSSGIANTLPAQWRPLIIHRAKKLTEYRLENENGKTVLHAHAAAASSGLLQRVSIDPYERPWLTWAWKADSLIARADNHFGDTEDSPVRILLGFDGDKDALPFADQIFFETAKLLTGRDMPYASLMYIWENKAAVDTVISNTRTGRVKMVVAASGNEGVGEWQTLTRNIVDDFERAYGEKPGRMIGVGILTDTDNTGETVDAWYGDIHSLRLPVRSNLPLRAAP